MGLKLKINTNISKVMLFNRNSREINITINNTTINQVNQIKYLGRQISANNSSSNIINSIIKKANRTSNFLSLLSYNKRGISPLKALQLHNTFMNSKIEYAGTSLSNLPKTAIKKIKTCTNRLHRRSLGTLKSTPVNIINHLTARLPLELQLKFITGKELIKCYAYKRPIVQIFNEDANINTSYNKTFHKYKHIIKKVHPTKEILYDPIFIKHFLNFFHGSLNKNQYNNVIIIGQLIKEKINKLKNKNAEIFFTDGSVTETHTGAAFMHYGKDTKKAFWTNEKLCSMSAELIAIEKTIDYCVFNSIKSIAILSDSKSGIQKIISDDLDNFIANQIREKIFKHHIKTELHFVPSHVGIKGNEEVDLLAKNAHTEGEKLKIGLTISDAANMIKNELWKEWDEEYTNIGKQKGTKYSQLFNTVKKTPWFKHTFLKPDETKRMNRILANHTYCNKTLFLLKVSNSENCDTCNCIEDADHIILNCTKYSNIREKFNKLKEINSTHDFLKEDLTNNIKYLNKFLNEAKIDI